MRAATLWDHKIKYEQVNGEKKKGETPKSLSSSASKLRVISSYQCHFLYACRMCLLIYFHYVALSKLSQSSALHCFTFPAVKLFFSVSFFNTCADGQEGVVWQPAAISLRRLSWTLTFRRSRQANSVSPNVLSGAPNGNFRKNICSEDDLRSRIFGTFVVKFLACLPLLGFSNI